MIIGLDVGGTHTDVVLFGENGLVRENKVLTDSSDLFNTVLTGLEEITQGIEPEKIKRIVLSTTLTTNAIVQKKNPEVGMIVSGGPGIDPEFFRTNEHYYAVSGSIDHRGREVDPIDENEILKIADVLKKEGIRNIGIVGKFSVRNPRHELKIHDILKDSFGKIFMGHQISGNLNFPRRIATTFLNTTIRPIHKKFFEAVKKSLEKKGLSVPIHILKADGGTMSIEASINFPGQSILSGPASSVMGAIAFASEEEETVVLDIGGTTTDIAVLINRVPLLEPLGITLGPYKTLIRSLETCSIGVGGDSVVRAKDGTVEIGPDRIGPAMAYGGTVPTPTDALVVLGKIKSGDKANSVKGIEALAKSLGTSPEETAAEILDLACKKILAEVRNTVNRINKKPVYTIHELREGYQVSPKQILIIGGPAPYFARRLEELSNLKVGVVPRWNVANALGAALARTTCEVTLFADTEQKIAAAPEEQFREMVSANFSKENAVKKAYDLLTQKALQMGAESSSDLETEVIEDMEFNMVRGFSTTGKNIRVKVQVKPGLIYENEEVAEKLLAGM
ncbi:hydantoinase/oxoprolinase family protein [Desulfonema magnum]|uniref:Hydantoinase/oxoprolinase n=1 Tax=Desulfonema magnum TaxID=45655 RepID=A0A975BUT3_9BACT|nr:hydantoinase/oxoprolinase family protein [Desulfonema magnum]QTA91732.1 Hydantoinase/oxoprolinase [Desulfonema magnum]